MRPQTNDHLVAFRQPNEDPRYTPFSFGIGTDELCREVGALYSIVTVEVEVEIPELLAYEP